MAWWSDQGSIDILCSSPPQHTWAQAAVMKHFLGDAKTLFVPLTAFFVWRSNKTNRSTARTQLLTAPLLDEKYFQHERNPQSIQKTIYQKTLNIVATVGLQMTGWHNTSDDEDPRFINDLRRQTFQLCVHIYAAYHRTKNIWYTLKIFCTLNLLGPIPWSWPWPRAWWPPWARLCSGCPRTRFRSLLFREPAQPDIPKRIKTYREAINDGQIDRLFKGILNQYVKGVAGRYDKKDLNLTIARYVNWRMNVCSMFVVMFVIYF